MVGRISVTVLLCAVLSLSAGSVGAYAQRASGSRVRLAQDEAQPVLLLSAVQLTDRVRYAVTVLRPSCAGMSNLNGGQQLKSS